MYLINAHAAQQARRKGFDLAAVYEAANRPGISTPSLRYPGQKRHISTDGTIVAIVDPRSRRVITVYENGTETTPRADQTDGDAVTYARRYYAARA